MDLSKGESLLVGFGVYILGFIINSLLYMITSYSVPFLSIGLAVILYFAFVRPNDGDLVYYLIGFFALLIAILIAMVFLVGIIGLLVIF